MTLLDILAVLLVLSAIFGFLNHHILRLPHAIGLVVVALAASLTIMAIDQYAPVYGIGDTVRSALKGIDFHEALMEGFLSALLFAGAVHVDLNELRERKWAIGLMATLGVVTSTFIIGTLTWYLAGAIGYYIPFVWALVFGALISPTDPVAVLGILKTVHVPPLLKAKIAGESLFNDGVGVVVFTIMVGLAVSASGTDIGHGAGHATDTMGIVWLFIAEALGGALLGLVCGLIAFWMMRSLDEHNLEVLITLALVAGTYALAIQLHISGPIAVVIAGLLIGNHGAAFAMSEKTREHVFDFWELTDEILNSILFLLIGLEVLLIAFDSKSIAISLLVIPVVLLARLIAVSIPIGLLSVRSKFESGAIRILTWGGLRGGISVALALSLPDSLYKTQILAATYAVVVFSIIVQGLTMKPLVSAILKDTGGGVEGGTAEALNMAHATPQVPQSKTKRHGQIRAKRKSKRSRRRK